MAVRSSESEEGGGEKELQDKNVGGSDPAENTRGRTTGKAELAT